MAFAFLWLASGATAFPISPAADSIFASECTSISHCRTIFGIVWSCLATIFACTWVAVHPNVPAPASEVYEVVFSRIIVTICALLVPEYIVAWAIRQFLVANHIQEDVKKWRADIAEAEKEEPEHIVARTRPRDSGVDLQPIIEAEDDWQIVTFFYKTFDFHHIIDAFKKIFMPDPDDGQ